MTNAADILEGMSLPQKTIQPKYFYDEQGSALFEQICRLPEYYLTRAEEEVLKSRTHQIAKLLGPQGCLLEFGSGASQKTRLILDGIEGRGTYVPIDISKEILLREAGRLSVEYPRLRIMPLCTDFTKLKKLPPDLESVSANRVLFFSGSTIGNFEPEDALRLLRNIGSIVGAKGNLVIGVDLVKDTRTLEAAYNDSSGVTAAFNRNLLAHLNREYGASFDLEGFEHLAFFNPTRSRIEMHLVSQRDQTVRIGSRVIRFRHGETIHTENSYKYEHESFVSLLQRAGFPTVERWTDPRALFAVYHAARGPRFQ